MTTPAPPSPPPAVSPPASAPAKPEPRASNIGGAVVDGLRGVGAPVMRFFEQLGNHLMLVARAMSWLPRRPVRLANYLEAGEFIGFGSLPIVLLVGGFTGMVMSLQSV